MFSRLLGAAVVMSLGTAVQAAPARPRGTVEVRWEAPPVCPDEQAVRAAVERHVGRPLAEIRERKLSIIATVHPAERHWALTVFTVTAEGTQERSLRYAHGCGPLADAAAVLIAMTIDPHVLGRLEPDALELLARTEDAPAPAEDAPAPGSEPAPASEPGLASEPVPAPVLLPAPDPPNSEVDASPPPRPARATRPRRNLDPRGAARVSGSVGWGDLPAAGGGLAGALALRLGRFQAELGAGGSFLRSVRLDLPDASGANFNLWTIGLRGGAVFPFRRIFEIPLMLGVEAGQIHVRGVRLIRAGDARTPWAALTLSTGLAVAALPVLAVVLAVDGFVPVTRPRFVVEDVGEIFRPRPFGVRALLGLEFRFSGKKHGPRGSP